MTVLEIIKAKTGLAELTPAQEVAVAEAEEYIKSYCHLDEVPIQLFYTWANMAIDAFAATEDAATPEGVAGPLSGVTMGDVTYRFADRQTAADRYNAIARGYFKVLNRYRKGMF